MHISQKNDAEFCGKVPLHQTNLVQPHGYLLIIDANTQQLLQASENINNLLGLPAREAVQTSLHQYIPEEQMSRLTKAFEKDKESRLPFMLEFNGARHLATVKAQSGYWVMEVERPDVVNDVQSSFLSVYQELKHSMVAIEEAIDIRTVCEQVAEELKRLSGFDKIMIYRFDEHWNGDVIAEVREEGMDSYLGLKFPASDVPRQARELYKKTPYRLIPNVDYEAVKLYPVLNPKTRMFTDLSDSNLRSVAQVHLEYLHNMKVSASMSTRIMVNQQLWGLIACHNREPKYLSYEMCSVFELMSQAISAKISGILNQESFLLRSSGQQMHGDIIQQVFQKNALSGIANGLLNLLKADGIAICQNHQFECAGQTPSVADMGMMLSWLQAMDHKGLYMETSLSSVLEQANAYADKASGILVLPLQPEKQHYILAFRREAARNITWGGKPHEAIQFEADQKKYHPRASFTAWRETVKNTSEPWSREELEMAENFRNSAVDFILNKKES